MRGGYDLAFHNFVGKQSKCPAGVAGRRLRAGQGNQLGLTLAIEDRLNRRRLAFLACKYRIQPFVDEFRTYARHHCNPLEILASRHLRSSLLSFTMNLLFAMIIAPCRLDPTWQESVFAQNCNSSF